MGKGMEDDIETLLRKRDEAMRKFKFLGRVSYVGTAVAISASSATLITLFLEKRKEVPPLEHRIAELTDSLQKSSRSISDIEQEIEQRKSLVDKLQEDARIAEGLKTLNQEQVDAVAATLRGQLKVQEDESWWGDVRMNVFFTLLGTLLGQLTWFIPWSWQRWARKTSEYSSA